MNLFDEDFLSEPASPTVSVKTPVKPAANLIDDDFFGDSDFVPKPAPAKAKRAPAKSPAKPIIFEDDLFS